MVGISYDAVEVLKSFADDNKITYLLLSDEQSETIDAYGMRNKTVRSGSRQDGIPHPGTFLLDRDGTVRAKLFETVRRRHANASLIEAARQVN